MFRGPSRRNTGDGLCPAWRNNVIETSSRRAERYRKIYTHIYLHTSTYAYICINICIYTHMYIYTYIQKYQQAPFYIYIYLHNTHIHTHRRWVLAFLPGCAYLGDTSVLGLLRSSLSLNGVICIYQSWEMLPLFSCLLLCTSGLLNPISLPAPPAYLLQE